MPDLTISHAVRDLSRIDTDTLIQLETRLESFLYTLENAPDRSLYDLESFDRFVALLPLFKREIRKRFNTTKQED